MKIAPRSKRPYFAAQAAQRIAIAATLVLAGNASAATDTWIGNSAANWNSPEWSPFNMPPLPGDILLFGAAGSAGTILNNDLPIGFNIGGITFTTGGSPYVINGNAITLDGNIVNSGTLLETINLPITLNVVGTSIARTFTTTVGGGNLKLGGVLSGAGGVTKTGAGTLTLANPANTYGGETLIGAGGILNVASLSDYGADSSIGNRLQSSENNTVTGIGIHIQGGTLQYTGSTPQSTNRQIRILNGVAGATIEASGSNPAATLSFTHTGANINLFDTAGTRTLNLTGTNTGANSFAIQLTDQATSQTSLAKAGTGTWYITNSDNTFTGETIFGAGILNVASLSDYGVASSIGSRPLASENATATGVSLHFQGGTLQYTGSTPQSTNREIRVIIGNGATIDASGSNPAATLSFTHTGPNRNLYDTGGTRNITLTGTNTGANSFSIQLTDLSAVNFTSLTKTGPGTWILNGPDANTNTGITTVRAGILSLAKSSALAVTGNLAIGDGSANAAILIGGPGGNQIADSSIATFNGTGATVGILRLNNFNETIGGINSVGGAGIIENESGTAGIGTLTVNVTGSQDYSGVLRDGDDAGEDGVLAITKTGAGTLILSGTTDHTGPTSVRAGTLTVNGLLSSGSSVDVSNATLNGSGTIAGPVRVANGGVLSSTGTVSGNVNLTSGSLLTGTGTLTGVTTAGNGSRISPGTPTTPGTLTLTSLVLSIGSLLDLEFGGTSDALNVTSTLALNGGAFNLYDAGGLAPLTTNGTYPLIDYGTSFTGALSNLSIANSQVGKFYSISNDAANTVIRLTIADTVISKWNGLGSNNKWSTAANWTGGIPNAAGAVATFGSVPTAPTVAVDGPKTVGGILFDSTAAVDYTLTGGVADILTLNNGVASATISATGGTHLITTPIVLATNANATTAAGSTLTFSGNITGAKAFTASGAGTTILTGANTFTTTAVTGGILQVGNNDVTGTLGSGDITVEAGGSLVFNRSNDIVVANSIFGSGAQITKLGAGTLTLSGTNTFSTAVGSSFNITAGTVKLGSAAALASGVILNLNGGTLDLNQNNVSIGNLNGASGVVTDNSAGAGTSFLGINQTSDSTFSGVIFDGPSRLIGINKTGTGALTLTGSNSYTGPLTITGGAVVAAGTGGIPITSNLVTLGDGTADVSLIAGATSSQFAPGTVVNFTDGSKNAKLMLRGSNQTLGGVDSTGAFNVTLAIIQNDEAGSPGYTGTSGEANLTLNTLTDHSFTGLVRTLAGGALNLIKEGPATQEFRNVLIGAASFGTATINAGKLTFNYEPNGSGTNVLGAATSILVNANGTLGLNGNWNMARPISGTGTVLKQGTGAITLSGANTFTGTTVLSQGSLTAATTTGPSLGGNVTIGTGTQAGIFLIMGAANQFGPNSVLTFNNGTARDAKLELRGFSQTVAGLSSDADDTLSIIQNQETGTPVAATLTINTATDYIFNGLIRTQSTGGLLSLVKEGAGTQEIRNVAAAPENFGTATINAGKLTFNLSGVNNTLGVNTSILINNSATLGLDGTWTMNRPVSGTGNVLKQGAGTVTMADAFSQTGGTTVSDGTLLVTGTISGSVNVTGAASILGGTGSIGGLTVQNGGTVAPGSNAAGLLNTTAGVTLATGTKLSLEINNTTGGSGYDQLNVTGAVSLGSSTLSLSGSYLTYPLVANDLFFVLLNDGSDAVNGTFNGIPEGGLITSDIGQYYRVTYQADAGASSFIGGNDIALMAVPEPGAAFSLLAGCGMLLGLRRRRRRKIALAD